MLRESIPLQRASMRLRLTLPAREARKVREKILPLLTVESENWESGDLDIVSSCSGCISVVMSCVHKPLLFSAAFHRHA